jgi:predicted CXXCH cytochrome family protein
MKGARWWVFLALAVAARGACVDCHTDQAQLFKDDVHARFGFTCTACHGGDAAEDDQDKAMSPAKGFRGKPARTAVPALCAKCHSDAALMHRYKPQQRVDQLSQYLTSVHGKRLAAGDAAVANCADCHGAHGIREVRDALSPVHPLKVPETCARCHADKAHMAKYKLPTSQFAEYRTSVHWEAVAKRGDLSAPTCASCHGNHGAAPPAVSTVAAMCGICHVLIEEIYRKSPHQTVFAAKGGGCEVCHSNHAIHRPSAAMLTGPDAVCAKCHESDSATGRVAGEIAGVLGKLDSSLNRASEILKRARNSGMEVSEAQMRQLDGHEALVKARVAVHGASLAAVEQAAKPGLEIGAEGMRAGEQALKERDTRRVGLALSLLTILVTLAGLWMAIRSMESRSGAEGTNPGR